MIKEIKNEHFLNTEIVYIDDPFILDDLTDELVEMVNNQDIKYKMGINGNLFYKKNLTVENAYNIISKHIKSNNIS